MNVLIDTHIAIWAVLNDPKLPKQAKDIILDKENDIFYSTASVWEITIKYMLHPDVGLWWRKQKQKVLCF